MSQPRRTKGYTVRTSDLKLDALLAKYTDPDQQRAILAFKDAPSPGGVKRVWAEITRDPYQTVRGLAQRLHMAHVNIGAALRYLEWLGYIERRRCSPGSRYSVSRYIRVIVPFGYVDTFVLYSKSECDDSNQETQP